VQRKPIRASIPPDQNGHVLPAETECNACASRINWPSGIKAKKYRQFHSQQSVARIAQDQVAQASPQSAARGPVDLQPYQVEYGLPNGERQ
jgi:hypothetical protein